MDISFDPAKRAETLADRGIDFADAAEVFAGQVGELEDTRRDYGERGFITAGVLRGRMVIVVWTPRNGSRRIISMRFAHEREQALWRQLDR
jgi:uncharacterized protein